WQLGTGYFGARGPQGFDLDRVAEVCAAEPNVRMIEVKLSQGAKPGKGGILPGAKVTPEIAAIRGVPVGQDCISPNAHTEFDDVDGLIDFVERIAERTAQTAEGRLGNSPKIGDLAAWWLSNVAAVEVRPATLHTYKKDASRIVEHLGDELVADLDVEMVRRFLAVLASDGLAASTRRKARARLRQIGDHAVELGYLASNPVPRVPAPKATAEERTARRTLTPEETRRLLAALDGSRSLDAAVAILFTSGLRVSEVLGLAWADLNLDAGTATVRRGCTYTGGGVGTRLDHPKTKGTSATYHLAPSAVALLRQRRRAQAAERLAAGPAWETITYEGQPLDVVFTTRTGALMPRQDVTNTIRRACESAGIDPAGIGTHTGRRSVITSLYVAGLPIDDVARHVGHASPTTTSGYVQDLGTRPADTARRAAELLDPAAIAGER
ncbi:MAG: tyrosine-type recombinase/integrase, partial [Acidimicrobiales bacterium]|nr:tyrosine-type recombinase/integrase [Acidimicrobiales bacterium]